MIVGSAEVVIRALGDKLESDIQKSLDRAGKGAGKSGENTGKDYGDGVNKGIEGKVDVEKPIADSLERGGATGGKKAADSAERELTKGLDNNKSSENAADRLGQRIGNSAAKGIEKSRFVKTIASAGAKLGIFVPVIGVLVQAVGALASGLFAIVSAAGLASESLIAIPGAIGAIVQAAAVTVIAFKGLGPAIKAGLDPTKAKQFQEALKKLSPEAQSFVKTIISMKPAFAGLQTAAQKGLFPGLSVALKGLGPLLSVLKPAFEGTGRAVGQAAISISKALTGPIFTGRLSGIMKNNEGVIKNFGIAIGNLAKLFVNLLSAAEPLTTALSKTFAAFTGHLVDLTTSNKSIQDLTTHFSEASKVMGIVWQATKNLFGGLYDIGKISTPTGVSLLKSFEGATNKLAHFTDSAKNVLKIKDYFSGVATNVRSLGNLFNALGAAILRTGSSPGLAKTANALTKVIPDIERALTAGVASVGPKIAAFIGQFAILISNLEESNALASVIGIFTGLTAALNALFGSPLGGLLKFAVQVAAIGGTLGLIAKVGGLAFASLSLNFTRVGEAAAKVGVQATAAGTAIGSRLSAGALAARVALSELDIAMARTGKGMVTVAAESRLTGAAISSSSGGITKVAAASRLGTLGVTSLGKGLRSVGTSAFRSLTTGAGSAVAGLALFAAANTKTAKSLHVNYVLMGAALGSVIPGYGTAIGAAIGAVVQLTHHEDTLGKSIKASNAAFADKTNLVGQKKAIADIQAQADKFKKKGSGFGDKADAAILAGVNAQIDKRTAAYQRNKAAIDAANLATKRLNQATTGIGALIDFKPIQAETNKFFAEFSKKHPVNLDINNGKGAAAVGQLQRFADGLRAINGVKPAGLAKTSTAIQKILTNAGASSSAATILGNSLAGVSDTLSGIPVNKKINIDDNFDKTLTGLGAIGDEIRQEIVDHNLNVDLLGNAQDGLSSLTEQLTGVQDPVDAQVGLDPSGFTGPFNGVKTDLFGLTKQQFNALLSGKLDPSLLGAVNTAKGSLTDVTNQSWTSLLTGKVDPSLPGAVNQATGALGQVDGKKANAGFGGIVLGSLATALGAVYTGVDQVNKKKGEATVGVKPDVGIASVIGGIAGSLLGIQKSKYTATLTTKVDASAIGLLQQQLAGIKGGTVLIKTSGDTSGIRTIKNGINGLKAKPVNIKTNGDTSGVKKISGAIKGLGKGATVSIKIKADSAGPVNKVKAAIAALPKTKGVKVSVTGNSAAATGQINKLKSSIAGLKSKSVTVTTYVKTVKSTVNAATGGLITGPGTGTSDSIPSLLSNGEFVVRAAMVKRFLPLLQSLNAGQGIPRTIPAAITEFQSTAAGTTSGKNNAGGGAIRVYGELVMRDGKAYIEGVTDTRNNGNVAFNSSLKRAGHR